MCGVPALSTTSGLRADHARLGETVSGVAREVAVRGGRLVLLAADSAETLDRLGVAGKQVVGAQLREDEHVLERRPARTDPLPVRVWLAPVPAG